MYAPQTVNVVNGGLSRRSEGLVVARGVTQAFHGVTLETHASFGAYQSRLFSCVFAGVANRAVPYRGLCTDNISGMCLTYNWLLRLNSLHSRICCGKHGQMVMQPASTGVSI